MELVETGFKETEVGLIPVDWKVKELNRLTNITRLAGYEYSTYWEETLNGEIIALRGFNIGKNKIIEREFVRISNVLSMRLIRSRLFKGDIIYPCVGTIGNATVINEDNKYHIQQNIAKITPLKDIIDSNYLAYYLMSDFGLTEIKKFNGTSSQPNILVGSLRQYSIILPPSLKEQKAIATALSDVDALIHSLEALIAKKKAIKQGAMQELLTGKTRLAGFENDKGYQQTEVGLIPVDWEVVELKELLLETPKYGIGAAAIKYNTNYPTYLRITDIDDNGNLIKRGMKSVNHPDYQNYILQKGELVFARTGASVGKSYLYNKKDGVLVYAGFLIKVKPNPEILLDSYLKEYVSTNTYWNWVLVNSMRSGQPGINSQEYGVLPIPIPPILEEQKAIAETLSNMDQEIQALQAKKEKYQAIKQGMMQELLTGKTRLISSSL